MGKQSSPERFDGQSDHRPPTSGADSIVREITEGSDDWQRQREALIQQLRAEQALLETRNEQLRVLATQLTSAEQRERRRIAHALHEHLQQLLAAAKMPLARVRQSLDDDALHAALERTCTLVDEAIETSRTLAVDLYPPILYDLGLAAALQWLGQRVGREGLRICVEADPDAEPASQEIQAFLFRAVQEILFHVEARSGTVEIRIASTIVEDRQVKVVVEIRGAALPADVLDHRTNDGMGLFGIQQRLELLGGHAEITHVSDRCSCITFTAPGGKQHDRKAPGEHRCRYDRGSRLRVLVVDDHQMLRDGLARVLDGECDIEVVGDAADGASAVRKAARLAPDVVLMDVSLPGMDGIEATRNIILGRPQARVIGLSGHDDDALRRRMLDAGAAAWLSKDVPTEKLLDTIRLVGHGG
jgi:CheY-like chemotaxis protein